MYQSKITVEEEQLLREAIAALDLYAIKAKLIRSKNWAPDYTDKIEKWYKRFLFLSHKYMGQPIVVNNVIDEFWHNHILDSRKYFEDCNRIFGYYLHHFPYFGMRGADDKRDLNNAFEVTNYLFLQEFGETEIRENEYTNNDSLMNDELQFFQATSCSDCTADPPTLSFEGEQVYEGGLVNFNYTRPSVKL